MLHVTYLKKDTTTKMKVDCGKLLKMYVKSLKNS